LLGFLTACGVPQEIYNARTLELDRCKADLTRAEGTTTTLKTRLDEEQGARDRAATVEAEYMRLKQNLHATEQQLEELKKTRSQAEARTLAFRALRDRLRVLIESHSLSVGSRRNLITVTVGEALLFERGSADLKPTGVLLLKQVASVLREIVDRDFVVTAHSDNQLAKGSPFHSNWDLTTTRAVTIVRQLQAEGVSPRHLAAAGQSEFDKLVDNDTDEHRALNRRIEITLMPNKEELPAIDASDSKELEPAPPPTPTTGPAGTR
jgi:chemotaxis protein MotB